MLDIRAALKNTAHASVSKDLQREFNRRKIDGLENLHNAPIKCRTTYGADIYKVIELIEKYYAKKSERMVKRGDSESST